MINIKKILQNLMKFLPHINIVLAITMITLFVTDRYNRAMKFLYNDNTKWLLLFFSISVVLQALIQIYLNRVEVRERNRMIDEQKQQESSDHTDYSQY
ncbi:MAG: hypothetical protein IJX76_00190 [Clostridia bacterium]|nr:hypothetical protein [Clostridia bacterium]